MMLRRRTQLGATLLEVLVSIGVIAVVSSILIVSLRSVLQKRNDVVDLSNLRQTMADFIAYSIDHDGAMPNFGRPGEPGTDWFYGNFAPDSAIYSYEAIEVNWPLLLSRWLEQSPAYWHSSHDDRDPDTFARRGGVNSLYLYSRTMITRHDAWTNPGLQAPFDVYSRRYFKTVLLSDITSPASKGVLRHDSRPGDLNLRHVAFADGRAALMDIRDGQPTAVPPLADPASPPGLPVMSTLNGHRGRDF